MRASTHTFVACVDIEKAFDTSWVEATLVRLHDIGVRGLVWNLLSNFLRHTVSQDAMSCQISGWTRALLKGGYCLHSFSISWWTALQQMGPRRVGPRRVGGPKFRAFFALSRSDSRGCPVEGGPAQGGPNQQPYHTHRHQHTNTPTHHTHPHTPTHQHTTHTHTHQHTPTHQHTNTPHTPTHTNTHQHTPTHTNTHQTHPHTPTHTQTHTHTMVCCSGRRTKEEGEDSSS